MTLAICAHLRERAAALRLLLKAHPAIAGSGGKQMRTTLSRPMFWKTALIVAVAAANFAVTARADANNACYLCIANPLGCGSVCDGDSSNKGSGYTSCDALPCIEGFFLSGEGEWDEPGGCSPDGGAPCSRE